MDKKIIDKMFYGNINYHSEGSFEAHTIKQNTTNVPDCCGFKINIGNNSTLQCSANKVSLIKEEDIMCLKSWTIIKKNNLGPSRLYEIKGKLYDQKNTNISGKLYKAGFIKNVIKKDLINTTKGKYRLITPPAEPKNEINKRFYTFWMVARGFPRKLNKL